MKNVKVLFEPDNIEIEVPEGTKISTAIKKACINFDLPCAGKGICGKCRVEILSGSVSTMGDTVNKGWVLACQTKINSYSHISLKPLKKHSQTQSEISPYLWNKKM